MTNEAFNKGFTVLNTVFPALNLDAKLFWTMLQDLDGQYFLMSVYEFIKNTKEIYPGTNIIATIRARAEELQTEVRKNNIIKIETETEKERIDRWQKEASPMPKDCRLALEKLGVKLR
jgi:hypothetical protein